MSHSILDFVFKRKPMRGIYAFLRVGLLGFFFLVQVADAADPRLRIQFQDPSGQWIQTEFMCSLGSHSREKVTPQSLPGVSLRWDSNCARVALTFHGESESSPRQVSWQIHSTREIELTGLLSVPLSVLAPRLKIVREWSSPELGFSFESKDSLAGRKAQGLMIVQENSVLSLGHLRLKNAEVNNQGRIEVISGKAPGRSLETRGFVVGLENSTLRNQGVIDLGDSGLFELGKSGPGQSEFIQEGRVRASSIQLGQVFAPLDVVLNSSQGWIQGDHLVGGVRELTNRGQIHASKRIGIYGKKLQNPSGSLRSEGELILWFETIENQKGSLLGVQGTTLHISGELENSLGFIGSETGPTELDFSDSGSASALGGVFGTEVHLNVSRSSSVELRQGFVQAKESISLFSLEKVNLPEVQIQTPLLNLSVPDFQLEPLLDCTTTVIHCNPRRDFCLTSPFMSQGEIRFLESDYCRVPKKTDGAQSSVSSGSSSSQALWSLKAEFLRPDWIIEEKTQALVKKMGDLGVFFERDQGYASQYTVSIESNLTSAQGVHFLLPEGRVFVGHQNSNGEAGIYAESLRVSTNYFLLHHGTVSTVDAYVAAPAGLHLGALEKDADQGVQVGEQSFPLLRRGNTLWTTASDCYLKGPLNCSGTLEIGRHLVLDSEKRQYLQSPDIHVHGNLLLKGEGPLKVIRHLGEHRYDQTLPLSSELYSEAEKFRVDGEILGMNAARMELFGTSLFADQSNSGLTFQRVNTIKSKPITFPGEEPQKEFRSNVSARESGIMRLEGSQSQGTLFTEDVFLIEDEGQCCLFAKNPYYFPSKDPLHSLEIRDLKNPKYFHHPNLKAALAENNSSRFGFEWRERSFFNPKQSNDWIQSIQPHLVINDANGNFSLLANEEVVFELSPKILLAQVQAAAQETLKRSYIDPKHPLDLDYLAQLHRNASQHLEQQQIFRNSKGKSDLSAPLLNSVFHHPKSSDQAPTAPLIFYQAVESDEGIRVLKAKLILPKSLIEEARSKQEGNVFAKVLGRFEAGMTVEQMLDSLDEKTVMGAALRKVLTKNHQIIQQINDNAARYCQELAEQPAHLRVADEIHVDHTLKSKDIAIVARDNLHVNADQKGNSAGFVSLQGKVKIQSKKVRKKTRTGFQDVIERRELDYGDGHLTVKAGGEIEISASDFKAGTMNLEGRDILDSAVLLESASDYKSGSTQGSLKEAKAQVSQMKVKGKLRMKARNHLVAQGTQAQAGSIDLEAGKTIAILGVQNHSNSSVTTEQKTGWFLWEGTETKTQTSAQTQFQAASLQATGDGSPGSGVISIRAQNETVLQAPEISADQTRVEVEKLRITQGAESVSESSTQSHESAWWISKKHKEEAHQTHTAMKLAGEMQLQVKKLEIEKVKGQVLEFLDQIHYDPKQVEVIEQLLEEFHHRDEKSISAPGPALVVAVTIASSLATAGVGGAIVGSSGTALAAAASAALSSVSAQVATQLTLGVLAQQSPGDILGKILSLDTLKSAATAALSAGALNQFGGTADVSQGVDYGFKIKSAGIQAGVGFGANLGFEGQDLGSALKKAGVQFVSQAAGSCLAGEIGTHFKDKKEVLDRCLHKVAHGAAAAGVAAFHAALTGQDVGLAVAGGVSGAVTSEIVADLLSPSFSQDYVEEVKRQEKEKHRPLTEGERLQIGQSKLADIARIAKISGAVSGLLTAGAPGMSSAFASSSNSIENNFLVAAAPLLLVAAEAALLEAATTTAVVGSSAGLGYAISHLMGEDESLEAPAKPIPQDPTPTSTGDTQYIPEDLGDASTQLIPGQVEASSSTQTPAHQPLPFGHHSTILLNHQGVEPLGGVYSEGVQDSAGGSASNLVGQKLSDVVRGYTKHGLNQAISRNNGQGVDAAGIIDAVKNPSKILEQANGVKKYVGEKATVIVSKDGKIITTYGKPRAK
ncbi:MAG: hypothetical protein ACO3A2_03435 [Bdellovibrionia bacterium]